MKVLYVVSEAAPFAKTGGLGDVGASFPAALWGKGAEVCAVMPLYEAVGQEWRSRMQFIKSFYVQLSWRSQYCGVFLLKHGGVDWYFLDNEYYFKRKGLYGHYDDGERFSFFSKAAVELIRELDLKPDIVHANDWQTALVPIYLRTPGDPAFEGIKSVFTIHNIEYQGRFGRGILTEVFGLSDKLFTSGALEFQGGISLMKGAMCFSDAITTVSPTYARELAYAFYAHGLEGVVSANAYKMRGILNGIDQTVYNPKTDEFLEVKYSQESLAGKTKDKRALQHLLHLNENLEVAVVAMVSRLTAQKGIDLITARLDALMDQNIQFVLLGRGDFQYEQAFINAQNRYPGRVSANIQFSDALAMRIYAGADLLLMPSKSEPCGLSQMIAMRYGTVPVVRETGGLRDTVPSYNPENGEGCGFTFCNFNADDMLASVKRALALFVDKRPWRKLVRYDMSQDFSWGRSAHEYLELYGELLDKK